MADVLQFPKLPMKPEAYAPKALTALADVMTGGVLQIGVGTKSNTSPLVAELQSQLKAWGFDPIEVDGIYGQHTADAVSALQRKLGVKVDGKFGNETRTAIKADLTSPTSVIRAHQKAMGLIGTSYSEPSTPPVATPAPGFLDKMKSLATSPYVWVGAAAIGAGGYWWFKKSRAEPKSEPVAAPVGEIEPYIPAELRVPTKRKRKTKKE